MCDKTCGGGTRTNIRVPKVDLQHGGVECTGHSTITESCNIQECPGKLIINYTIYRITRLQDYMIYKITRS